MTNATIAASFLDDFTYTYFGDARLTARLCKVAAALACDPTATLPESCATEADVEGMYRLLNNERVTFDAILAPHHAATAARCGDYPFVRLIHDTTDVMFSGEKKRRGLGRINGNDQGFLLHVTLATTAGELPLPLGVAAVMPWIREDEKTPRTPHGQSGRHGEFRRWEELALLAEVQVPTGSLAIHIMDSEADAYALMAALSKSLFVIRAFRDRAVIASDAGQSDLPESIRAVAGRAAMVLGRLVALSRRSAKGRPPSSIKEHPARDGRLARLSIAATSIRLRRGNDMPKDLPTELPVNMVVVREIDPPEEFEPVDWILYTSLPVDTAEQIEAIVDHYRGRWLIEEFNKALKTGCSLESRQLESLDSLLTLTAILIPIACQSLALRAADRVHPEAPASTVMAERQVIILRSLEHLKVPEAPTVHDALLAVARLGGHLRHNGPPGWLVLARGLRKLLLLEEGWLAREGCDQS